MFSTITYEYYKEHGFHSDIIESCLAHKEKNRVKAYDEKLKKSSLGEAKIVEPKIPWYRSWFEKQ
jgi:hypothetical protein